jgi:site-specific DNA recombinase
MPVSDREERRIVGYVRVSSEEQALTGVSLDAQKERIRAYAVATERVLDDVVVDAGVSAKTLDRPGLRPLLEDMRDGLVGAVIVLKLDRLTRSMRDLGELLDLFSRANVALVSVSESLDTETAAGRLLVNILGGVAQWEREAIAERTAFALGHKRRSGAVYGRTPFGYRRDGGRLIPDAGIQAILTQLRTMRADGQSYRDLAAWLAAEGVRTPQGAAKWHPASVRAILESRIAAEQTAHA